MAAEADGETASEQQGPNNAEEGGTENGAPMSKRQQKRLLKRQRIEEAKQVKRQEEKRQKTEQLNQKREDIKKMLGAMTEIERQKWQEEQHAKKELRMKQRAEEKSKAQKALEAPQKLVIDLDFQGKMTVAELKSLCQQLSYSYSFCTKAEQPCHLHLLGVRGDIQQQMERQLPGYKHWHATVSEDNVENYFKERLPDLVYLTADSPDELTVLDTSKVYVIGGIVDRNRHKGICYNKAQAAGIATAKLPIGALFKLQTSAVITVNQVVDILVRYQTTPDWQAVLSQVLPERKIAGPAAAAGAKKAASPGAGDQQQQQQQAQGQGAVPGKELSGAEKMDQGQEAGEKAPASAAGVIEAGEQ